MHILLTLFTLLMHLINWSNENTSVRRRFLTFSLKFLLPPIRNSIHSKRVEEIPLKLELSRFLGGDVVCDLGNVQTNLAESNLSVFEQT